MSEFARIYKSSNTKLRAALDALPGYAAHQHALVTLSEGRKGRRRPADRADLANEVAAALVAGDPFPEDIDQEAQAGDATLAAHEAAEVVLRTVEARIVGDLALLVRTNLPALFATLDEVLRDTVDKGRCLRLAGIVDADAAIEAGKAKDWSAMRDLRATYEEIRSAQAQLMFEVDLELFRRTRGDFSFIRNAGELFPAWLASRRDVPVSFAMDGSPQSAVPPWPDDDAGRFLWLVNHPEAEPWVPSPEALRDAHAAAYRAADAELKTGQEVDRMSERQANWFMELMR